MVGDGRHGLAYIAQQIKTLGLTNGQIPVLVSREHALSKGSSESLGELAVSGMLAEYGGRLAERDEVESIKASVSKDEITKAQQNAVSTRLFTSGVSVRGWGEAVSSDVLYQNADVKCFVVFEEGVVPFGGWSKPWQPLVDDPILINNIMTTEFAQAYAGLTGERLVPIYDSSSRIDKLYWPGKHATKIKENQSGCDSLWFPRESGYCMIPVDEFNDGRKLRSNLHINPSKLAERAGRYVHDVFGGDATAFLQALDVKQKDSFPYIFASNLGGGMSRQDALSRTLEQLHLELSALIAEHGLERCARLTGISYKDLIESDSRYRYQPEGFKRFLHDAYKGDLDRFITHEFQGNIKAMVASLDLALSDFVDIALDSLRQSNKTAKDKLSLFEKWFNPASLFITASRLDSADGLKEIQQACSCKPNELFSVLKKMIKPETDILSTFSLDPLHDQSAILELFNDNARSMLQTLTIPWLSGRYGMGIDAICKLAGSSDLNALVKACGISSLAKAVTFTGFDAEKALTYLFGRSPDIGELLALPSDVLRDSLLALAEPPGLGALIGKHFDLSEKPDGLQQWVRASFAFLSQTPDEASLENLQALAKAIEQIEKALGASLAENIRTEFQPFLNELATRLENLPAEEKLKRTVDAGGSLNAQLNQMVASGSSVDFVALKNTLDWSRLFEAMVAGAEKSTLSPALIAAHFDALMSVVFTAGLGDFVKAAGIPKTPGGFAELMKLSGKTLAELLATHFWGAVPLINMFHLSIADRQQIDVINGLLKVEGNVSLAEWLGEVCLWSHAKDSELEPKFSAVIDGLEAAHGSFKQAIAYIAEKDGVSALEAFTTVLEKQSTMPARLCQHYLPAASDFSMDSLQYAIRYEQHGNDKTDLDALKVVLQNNTISWSSIRNDAADTRPPTQDELGTVVALISENRAKIRADAIETTEKELGVDLFRALLQHEKGQGFAVQLGYYLEPLATRIYGAPDNPKAFMEMLSDLYNKGQPIAPDAALKYLELLNTAMGYHGSTLGSFVTVFGDSFNLLSAVGLDVTLPEHLSAAFKVSKLLDPALTGEAFIARYAETLPRSTEFLAELSKVTGVKEPHHILIQPIISPPPVVPPQPDFVVGPPKADVLRIEDGIIQNALKTLHIMIAGVGEDKQHRTTSGIAWDEATRSFTYTPPTTPTLLTSPYPVKDIQTLVAGLNRAVASGNRSQFEDILKTAVDHRIYALEQGKVRIEAIQGQVSSIKTEFEELAPRNVLRALGVEMSGQAAFQDAVAKHLSFKDGQQAKIGRISLGIEGSSATSIPAVQITLPPNIQPQNTQLFIDLLGINSTDIRAAGAVFGDTTTLANHRERPNVFYCKADVFDAAVDRLANTQLLQAAANAHDDSRGFSCRPRLFDGKPHAVFSMGDGRPITQGDIADLLKPVLRQHPDYAKKILSGSDGKSLWVPFDIVPDIIRAAQAELERGNSLIAKNNYFRSSLLQGLGVPTQQDLQANSPGLTAEGAALQIESVRKQVLASLGLEDKFRTTHLVEKCTDENQRAIYALNVLNGKAL